LLLVYFTCLGHLSTFAQTNTDSISKKIRLAEVEITARRSPAVFSEVGRLITVVPRSEIEAMPVQSIQGLLRYVMNVDVRERGPLGVQADLSIRGGSFDQVMVLLNGVNITDPQTGHHTLDLPVDLKSIDRIEILEGPAARVYGPNAFSGAINIITASSERNRVSVSAMGGQYGLYSVGAMLNHNSGPVTNYLSAENGGSDGYIDNTDFSRDNLFYQFRYQKNKELFNFQAGYTRKDFGANSFYSGLYPNQFEQTRTFFSALNFETGEAIRLKPTLYWRRHHDRFELFRDGEDAPSWYSGHNYHLTDVFGGGLNATIPSKFGQSSLGGEVRSESVWSNVLGQPMLDTLKVPGESEGLFTRSYSRTNASLFLEHNVRVGQMSLSAGVMANFNSGLDYRVDWFPGIDLSYWFGSSVKWIASYNRSLRMPTFTDLFYSGSTNVGNQRLKPEEASTIETGIIFFGKGVKGHLNGFYRKGKNLIDWGRTIGENSKYTTSNINRITVRGLESSLTLDVETLALRLPLLQTITINYAYLDQDKAAREGYESVYVLNHLKHKLTIGVDQVLFKNFTARWMFLYQEREGFFVRTSDNLTIDYQPFWLTDLRVAWRSGKWRVYGEAANLFDASYFDMGELSRPGRWLRLGLEVNIGY
jgi:iron complex outermembrane receptor protein